MADWYVSSAAYALLPQFAVSSSYSVGQIVRPLTAPALGHAHVFRCTTAGASGAEPTWPAANNSTITTGGATFTNVTGQSAYGWGAAAGDLYSLSNGSGANRPVPGDRVFLSSDHSENLSGSLTWAFGTENYGLVQIISVNRAGSVPPVVADALKGAAITCTVTTNQLMNLSAETNCYWEGITFTLAGTPSTNALLQLQANHKNHYFKNCAFVIATTTGTAGGIGIPSGPAKVIFDNTTVQFSLAAQFIGSGGSGSFELTWINTPAVIQGGTIPTSLFSGLSSTSLPCLITCRGVDFSAITGTLVNIISGGSVFTKALFDSCRIASGVTRLAAPGINATAADEVELVNCYDGTNVINERHTAAGDITTDRSTYLSSGAQDDIGNYALKLVSSARNDFCTFPLDCFAFDVENTVTGASKTATVEIVSSGTLNNNDIRLLLEYMGTSGNPVASFVDSLASVLTAASALPSSSNTWNNPPATPQKQLLQVSFTPQRAGRVRGLVRLGKVSTTVWVNPQIAIA